MGDSCIPADHLPSNPLPVGVGAAQVSVGPNPEAGHIAFPLEKRGSETVSPLEPQTFLGDKPFPVASASDQSQ